MDYNAFVYKMFCRPTFSLLEDQGIPVPDTVFIIDPNAPNPFRDIGLSRAFQLAEEYEKASIIEKWKCAQQFVTDVAFNRIRFLNIRSADLYAKQPNVLGSVIALDFWFFTEEIKKETLMFGSHPIKEAAFVIMGVEPVHYNKWERMRDLLNPFTDIDNSGLTWGQKEVHPLFQIFLECHSFIEKLLENAIACNEVEHFLVDGETRLRLKNVVEWAQTKSIQTPAEVQDMPASALQTVNIPASLWAGKAPKAVCESLEDYDKGVVAIILSEKMNISKTETGRLLSTDDLQKNLVHDPKTYQARVDSWIKSARARYRLTFIN